MNTQAPSLGRVVLFAFADAAGAVHERAAEVVRTFPGGNPMVANLHVKLDGANDSSLLGDEELSRVSGNVSYRMIVWRTSVLAADDQAVPQAGRWRWPPRV